MDAALEPLVALLGEPAPANQAAVLETLLERQPGELLGLLRRHRVDQLVYRAVLDAGLEERLPPELDDGLRQTRRRAAAHLMLQLEAARRATRALADAGIVHVFFKGLQLGEELYGDAVLRPSADADLLLAEADRDRALARLVDAGFTLAPEEGQPEYQVTLAGLGAHLDLHWHPIAPERSRRPLTDWILASRREGGEFPFPDPAATLVVLLVNPALTDHVTSRLIHAVDVDRFVRSRPGFDWQPAVAFLDACGLKTAAWAMLVYARRLLATPIPAAVEDRLAPGRLRRAYLRRWLARDPAALYGRAPLLVRAGFSLFLHDRPRDGLRAIRAVLARRPHPVTGAS